MNSTGRPAALHRQLREALERGELPPEPVRASLVAALDLAENQRSLDRGFGLSPTWWRDDAHRRRNELIAVAHQRFFADLPLRQTGARIAGIARELRSRRFRSVIPDSPEEIIEAALKTGAAFPSTGRQIENLLRAEAGAKLGGVQISRGDFAQQGGSRVPGGANGTDASATTTRCRSDAAAGLRGDDALAAAGVAPRRAAHP